MTPEENALLAKLDGKFHEDRLPTGLENAYLPDYDDLNNLMPLAWKKRLIMLPTEDISGGKMYMAGSQGFSFTDESDNPKQAIQQALLAIAREKFSGADTSV